MTRLFARIASRITLGLSVAAFGLTTIAFAQTTTETPPDAATEAPATTAADPGVSMGIPDGMPDQASAAMNSVYLAAKFDDWEQRCVKREDGSDPCQLYQLLKDAQGNPISEISFFTLPDGSPAAIGATIMAPLETLLTANMRIAIDKASGKLYPFSFCTVNGCVAKVGFTADELATMKNGSAAYITIVPAAAPDKTVQISLSLKGFTAGYEAIKAAAAAKN